LKKLPLSPLLSIAAVLMAPAVTQAQSQAPSTPSTPSTAATPSTPTTPTGTSLPGAWEGPTTFPGMPGIPSAAAPQAAADVFQFRVGAGVERDSNVLRQPTAVSDTIGILSVGMRADKRFGLQRFRADVEATAFRYSDVSALDYNTFNYNAAWDWSFTPKLHGVVSADRKQYRETFLDTATGINRVGRRTERTELAEGIYELGAAWRLLAGAAQTSSKSSQPGSWDASPEVQSVHAGVGYELASGTSLTGRLRRGDGEYNDPSAAAATGDFKETEADVLLKWPVTGKTSVDARLGHFDREHSGAPQRDFSGLVGNATVAWEVTGKTRVLAGVSRYLSASGLATGGHVESDQVWLGPVWKPTVQTAVKLRYERTAREWRDVPAASPDAGRREVIENIMAGFDWEPRRAIAVSTSIRRERLKSNFYSGYRATIFGVAAKVYF
jgi:exopolysaccharide biosynthesis operon protein EpsL